MSPNQPRYLGSCEQYCENRAITYDCCDSCHREDEEGYHDLSVRNKYGEYPGRNDDYFEICCAGFAFDKKKEEA